MVIRISGGSHNPEPQEPNSTQSPFHLFEDIFNGWALRNALAHRRENWKPPVDVLEKDSNIIIRAEIPGIDDKDIELKLDGRTLVLKGEKKAETEGNGCTYHRIESFYGSFSRSFDLPASVDAEKISAAYNNGIIAITIPQKSETQARSIRIEKEQDKVDN
jgi:HSP20 family protein